MAAEAKTALRKSIRDARKSRLHSAEESSRLSQQLGQLCLDQKAECVAAYFPIDGEPDIRDFLDWAIQNQVRVLLPVVAGDHLEWIHFQGETKFGAMGFEEGSGQAANLSEAKLIFVPALAVDLSGNRLGKGKGYYDRALAGKKQKTIGVVFDEEILLSIPTENHDHPLTAAISASKLIWFKR